MTAERTSWMPLFVIIGSMIMMYVTSFGVNVLIGAIVQDLQTTVANVQFVIVSASLIAGSLMVTAGKLGDKLGKKKVFAAGVAIYTIGLVVVLLSPNIQIFTVAWGLIWPFGMVLVIPTSIALIMYFYKGEQRAAAFGIYGAVLSIISAVAPLIVGALSNEFGWRIALAISPVAGVLTFLLALSMPETDKNDSVSIDIQSVLLSLLGFGIFLIATTMASQYGWWTAKRPFELGGSPLPLGGLSIVPYLYAISIGLLLLFVLRGARLKATGKSPLMDISILSNGTFTVGMLIGALLFLVTAGTLFALSVYLQAGVKFDSLSTALTLLPFSAAYAIVSFGTSSLGAKIAPKWIIIAGSAVTIAALWWVSEAASMKMSTTTLLIPMIVLGSGMGSIMAQITSVTMSDVAAEDSGDASGLSETLKEIIGQGFAVALAGSVLFGAVYGSMVDQFDNIEQVELSDGDRQTIIVELENTFQEISEAEEKKWVEALPEKTRQAYPAIVSRAADAGLKTALIVMMICMGLGLVLSFFLPAKRLEADSTE